jgi:hypothetical protein
MATVECTPRGRGFEVRLHAGALSLVARGTELDAKPELTGDRDLLDNLADLDRDGTANLVRTDVYGDIWLYPGRVSVGYHPRKQIAAGR